MTGRSKFAMGVGRFLLLAALMMAWAWPLSASPVVLSQQCRLALGTLRGETALSGDQLFATAQALRAASHKAALGSRSRELTLSGVDALKRRKIFDRLREELWLELSDLDRPANPVEMKSPLATGNAAHMNDHDSLLTIFSDDYSLYLGTDPRSLRLVTAAHDLGKVTLHRALQKYIDKKLAEASEAAPLNSSPGVVFVKQYVTPHEEHGLVYLIPKVVEKIAREFDLSAAQAVELASQLTAHVSHHNFGPLHVDPRLPAEERARALKLAYPDLSPDQIALVDSAFWVRFYGRGLVLTDGKTLATSYATDLGISPIYGQPSTALGAALALNDRITLVTDGAMNKIGGQNLSRTGFNPQLIEQTFFGMDSIGNTTEALVRAQFAELNRFRQSSASPLSPETFAPSRYGLYVARKATELGERLRSLNTPERFRQFGIGNEAPRFLLYADPSDRNWYKVDAGPLTANPQEKKFFPLLAPRVYRWVADSGTPRWVEMPTLPPPTLEIFRESLARGKDIRNAWDVLLDLVRNDGFRIPMPEDWERIGRPLR